MIQPGKMYSLRVVKKEEAGVILGPVAEDVKEEKFEPVFLPNNQGGKGLQQGQDVEAFVYIDPDGELVATTIKPKLMMGQLARLQVVSNQKFGAFLDWGLDKDLLLPTREQVGYLRAGEECLVALHYNEKTNRMYATMEIYEQLSSESPYKKNEMVQGTVYKINPDLGVFVAVDDQYHGLILNKEMYGEYDIGDVIEVRVKNVREDGKLELSTRKPAHSEIEVDAQKILDCLRREGGALAFNDNTPPEVIKEKFSISKKAFKRALGRLLKEGAITITEEGIRLVIK